MRRVRCSPAVAALPVAELDDPPGPVSAKGQVGGDERPAAFGFAVALRARLLAPRASCGDSADVTDEQNRARRKMQEPRLHGTQFSPFARQDSDSTLGRRGRRWRDQIMPGTAWACTGMQRGLPASA
jgi:hypothetical protein